MTGPYFSALDQLQTGLESSWGTPNATATAKLDALALTFDFGTHSREKTGLYGSLMRHAYSVITDVSPTGSVSLDCVYEDMVYWLESLFGTVTPGASTDYLRTYVAPDVAVTPRSQTLQFGQANDVYQLEGVIATGMTLSGNDTDAVKATVPFFGTKVSAGTLQALSDRTLLPILSSQCAFYLDAFGGTVGSTAVATTAYAWELSIDPKRAARKYLGAGYYPTQWNDGSDGKGWDTTLKLSLETNSTSAAYLTSIMTPAVPQALVQIKYDNGLATTSHRQFMVQFAGQCFDSPTFGNRNGLKTFDITLHGSKSTGAFANMLKILSVTAAATIT